MFNNLAEQVKKLIFCIKPIALRMPMSDNLFYARLRNTEGLRSGKGYSVALMYKDVVIDAWMVSSVFIEKRDILLNQCSILTYRTKFEVPGYRVLSTVVKITEVDYNVCDVTIMDEDKKVYYKYMLCD